MHMPTVNISKALIKDICKMYCDIMTLRREEGDFECSINNKDLCQFITCSKAISVVCLIILVCVQARSCSSISSLMFIFTLGNASPTLTSPETEDNVNNYLGKLLLLRTSITYFMFYNRWCDRWCFDHYHYRCCYGYLRYHCDETK